MREGACLTLMCFLSSSTLASNLALRCTRTAVVSPAHFTFSSMVLSSCCEVVVLQTTHHPPLRPRLSRHRLASCDERALVPALERCQHLVQLPRPDVTTRGVVYLRRPVPVRVS
jgi:hypothetical protein